MIFSFNPEPTATAHHTFDSRPRRWLRVKQYKRATDDCRRARRCRRDAACRRHWLPRAGDSEAARGFDECGGAQVVQLTIDFGDGAEKRFTAIAFREGITVLDVLEAAKAHPHGVAFASRGSGAMTLVTKIDDVANQEGAAGAKNWLFFVNEKLADRGCGAASVKPGDSILWRYQVKE